MRLGRFIAIGILGLGLGGYESAAAQSVGIKGGVSFGTISHKELLGSNLDWRTGGVGGIAFATGSGTLALGIEGLWVQRGVTSDDPLAAAETRLDYIDVPVYLKVGIPYSSVRPFVYIGPQVSFEVHCRTANGGDCLSQGTRKKTDFAGVVGAGIRFGGRATGISLEGRYVHGFRDLELSPVPTTESFRNRSILVLLGLVI